MLKIGVITMALLSFLNAGWLGSLFDSTPTPPISVPIDLSQAGSVVEMDVRIKETWGHDFLLDFVYKADGSVNIDAKKVRKFLGFNSYDPHDGVKLRHGDYEQAKRNLGDLIDETYDCDGTIVPIKLTIHQINKDNTKKLIVDKLYMTKGDGGGGWNGGAGSAISRDIESISLDKGKYVIRVENIQAFSEMNGREVKFTILMGRRYK